MRNALKKIGESVGWSFHDEEGSILGERDLGDRSVRVDLNDIDRAGQGAPVSTQLFAYASFYVLRRIHARLDQTLGVQPQSPQDARAVFSAAFSAGWEEEHIRHLSEVEKWARSLNPEESILRMASQRPDGPSGIQLNHLAALPYLGRFDVLEEYAAAFEKGFRLNFVPMITGQIIKVALHMAYDRYAEPGTEPTGAANRSQPGGPAASRTSSAADSRR